MVQPVKWLSGRQWLCARFHLIWGLVLLSPLNVVCFAQAVGMPGFGRPGGPASGLPPTAREQFRTRLIDEGGPVYAPGPNAPLVVDVIIRGNETVPESEIIALLRTRKERYFDPEVVQADVRRLVTQGKFRDVRTYTQQVEGGVVVTFEVFEVPTIRYVKFLGNRSILDKTLLRQSGLKIGDPLNRFSVQEGRRKIEEHYRSKGFSHAQVSILEGDQPSDRGVVYVISEGFIERVWQTQFVGNTFASDARLKTLIKSKPGWFWIIQGVVDRKQIDQDVERLTTYYRSFGFFSARVSRELQFDESGKWLTLTFVIDEGPRYRIRNVSVEGNQKFTRESLQQQLKLRPGDFFDLNKMNADVNALRDAYGAVGHIFAEINAEPQFLESPGELDMVYHVVEGEMFRVGEVNVHIAGEYPHTRRSVVLNRLSFFPGDVVDLREVRSSERRLKASQLFEVNPATGDAPRIVVRPPELKDLERLASPDGQAVRGQNPQ
jgi:outer membrane protein insertion porin family